MGIIVGIANFMVTYGSKSYFYILFCYNHYQQHNLYFFFPTVLPQLGHMWYLSLHSSKQNGKKNNGKKNKNNNQQANQVWHPLWWWTWVRTAFWQ